MDKLAAQWHARSAGATENEAAIRAASTLCHKGEMTDNPATISLGRWGAMISQLLINGIDKGISRHDI